MTKTFADEIRARVFFEEKLSGQPVDAQAILLREVAVIKKAVSEFLAKDDAVVLDLEAEITRLRNELAAARSHRLSPPETHKPQDHPSTYGGRADVRLFRPNIAVKFGVPAAIILQQLRWLLRQENSGKVLDDGKRYVYNTYPDWRRKFFPFYSVPTLERAFGLLENKRLVASIQPEGRQSRRKWYTLTPEGINLMDSGGNEGAKSENPSHQFDEVRKPSNCGVPSSNNETPPDVVGKMAPGGGAPATTSSSEQLIQELRKEYPDFDVTEEFNRFLRHRKDIRRPPTERAFRQWMQRAEPVLSRPQHTKSPASTYLQNLPPPEEADVKFLEEFETLKRQRDDLISAYDAEHEADASTRLFAEKLGSKKDVLREQIRLLAMQKSAASIVE